MIQRCVAVLALIGTSTSPVMAQGIEDYVGTWAGRTLTGQTVQIEIPDGVAQGQPVTYVFNGQPQEPQTPVVMGDRIRLNNSGPSYILLGPLKGNTMRFARINGQSQALANLTKR